MILLKPQPIHEKYYEPIEAQLRKWIYTIIYAPLRDIIEDTISLKAFENVNTNVIERAIRSGTIQYKEGVFYGRFNAALSLKLREIGARWDKRRGVFKIDLTKIPEGIRVLAGVMQANMVDINNKVKKKLQNIEEFIPNMVEESNFDFNKPIQRVTTDFNKLYKQVTISPDESPEVIASRSKEYSDRIKPYIKNWANENILQLRQDTNANALSGYRADHLARIIKKRYGTSKSKAKFLARQETSLFMSKYRETKFKSMGVNRFKWSTSRDSRVRQDHKDLHGRIFSYANPPIIDKATGKTGLPGQGFGCRCIDIPILEGVSNGHA